MKIECQKYQVNGLFEIKSDNWDECLHVLSQCSALGLKSISIQILEVKLLPKD